MQGSSMDYLLRVLSDECVAGHNKKAGVVTGHNENRHTISCDSHKPGAGPKCCF